MEAVNVPFQPPINAYVIIWQKGCNQGYINTWPNTIHGI